MVCIKAHLSFFCIINIQFLISYFHVDILNTIYYLRIQYNFQPIYVFILVSSILLTIYNRLKIVFVCSSLQMKTSRGLHNFQRFLGLLVRSFILYPSSIITWKLGFREKVRFVFAFFNLVQLDNVLNSIYQTKVSDRIHWPSPILQNSFKISHIFSRYYSYFSRILTCDFYY